MTVSFCVIAYNEEKALPSLFRDIRNQNYPHEKMEVILVNAMSTDRTKVLMEEFAKEDNGFIRVVVVDNVKKIQAAGWNVAILESKCDVIIRIDAHTMIPSDFVSKNIDCLNQGEFISGGPRPNIAVEDTAWQKTLLLAEDSLFGSSIAPYRKSHHQSYVKSVFHGAYRREVFDKAGLFDEQLGRTEDNEMHYRIRKSGYKICYNPRIVSYQHIRNSWKGMIKQKFANGVWIGLTMGVCPQCFALYHFVPLGFVLAIIVSLVLFSCHHAIPLIALAIVYGIVDIVMTIIACKKKKLHLQYLALPFIFLSLHFSYGVGTLIGLIRMPFWRRKYNQRKQMLDRKDKNDK